MTMSDDRKPQSESVFTSQLSLQSTENQGMIGASAPMRALFGALPRIATSSSPLLIRGERGTGKDLIARAVHALSDRAGGAFVTVDCEAVPEKQVRSRLRSALESAHGGTVMLDNVGALSADLQARLLRALRNEPGDVPATGAGQPGIRVISTTDADLEMAVESGRFGETLYYRLNVLSIEAPPLRERGRDVQLLADYFLERFTTPGSRRRIVGLTAEARLAMQQWSWPGNVRELMNRVKKAIVMCEKGPLYSTDLDLDSRAQGRLTMTLDEARDAAELSALLTALAAANGDLGVAAARLETTRAALCCLMQKHRIDVTTPQLVVHSDD